MRLIDADELKKEVDNFQNCYNGWSDTYDKSFIIGAIEEQPSIDIVHCKDCKHKYVTGTTTQYYVCDFMDAQFDEKGYCHHGERIDNEM